MTMRPRRYVVPGDVLDAALAADGPDAEPDQARRAASRILRHLPADDPLTVHIRRRNLRAATTTIEGRESA